MNIDTSFITNAITIAIETIALIEALKVFLKKITLPSFIYVFISLFVSFGLALLQSPSLAWVEVKNVLPIGLLAFSLSQIGYDTLIQTVKKKINSFKEN